MSETMSDDGKLDPRIKGRIEREMRDSTVRGKADGRSGPLMSIDEYEAFDMANRFASAHAFAESDDIYEECIANQLNPKFEFKRRVDEKIASLEPSALGLIFILVSEVCFQRKIERLQAVRDLCRVRDQYPLEQTS